ncbi:MAG: PhnD/SsuA/transferrin family substrate-binding protein [Deltaproteobacteria bacterium]|nr:PhnD/SsuA/transferrin family substrate-binding protein [Deltaproteobacteria bacterium]
MSGCVRGAVPALLLFLVLGACRSQRRVAVDFSRKEPVPAVAASDIATLRLAVGAMVGPRETYESYASLMEYLARRAGRRADLVQRRTYEETNRLLLDGEIDVAFICTGAYVAIRDRVRLLAAPVVAGSPSYASVFVARRGGPGTLEALRDTRFAFTDPLSNSGRLYPIYLLRRRFAAAPREFFAGVVYSGGHDESIRLVLDGAVEAAAVDSLVWDGFAGRHPEQAGELAVIHRSPPFGSPPFVARADLDLAVVESVRSALLGMAGDVEGGRILAGLRVERFVAGADYAFAIEVAGVALAEDAPPSFSDGGARAEAP